MARSRTILPLYAQTQGGLVLSAAPTPGLVGQLLLEAGALGPGDYECEIASDGCNVIEVELLASALTGSITMYLRAMRWWRAASIRGAASEDSDAIDTVTPITLTLADLRGKGICKVMFTVGVGESVTFAPGTDPTTPTAIAEFNQL